MWCEGMGSFSLTGLKDNMGWNASGLMYVDGMVTPLKKAKWIDSIENGVASYEF